MRNRCLRLARVPSPYWILVAAVAVVLAALTRSVAEEPKSQPPPAPAPTAEVEVIRDVVYRDLADGEDATRGKNKLDVYVPKGRKDFPVVIFVHGGVWRGGDKAGIRGLYRNVGTFLAEHGLGAVVANYRLSPAVQHPAHAQDVAKAVAWTHKNIARYGGRPDQLFLSGHSAGGHLIALLATDPDYLKAERLSPQVIKGIIPISGVYDLSVTELSLLLTAPFGKDPEGRKKASPLYQVRSDVPPALIVYADNDFLGCGRVSEAFCRALREKKCEARTLQVKNRDHLSVVWNITKPNDPVGKALLDFVAAHTAGARPAAASGGQ
jgi:acetyl esterase/lipase